MRSRRLDRPAGCVPLAVVMGFGQFHVVPGQVGNGPFNSRSACRTRKVARHEDWSVFAGFTEGSLVVRRRCRSCRRRRRRPRRHTPRRTPRSHWGPKSQPTRRGAYSRSTLPSASAGSTGMPSMVRESPASARDDARVVAGLRLRDDGPSHSTRRSGDEHPRHVAPSSSSSTTARSLAVA